jgi:predicted regulator of Ras-like GTPase activity (Roadblock/LC7/MglB family)
MSETDPVIPQVGVHGRELNWLVDRFVDETPGVAHAVVITEDGLLMAVSDRLRRDRAEQIAAVTAGMASLVVGAAKAIAGGAVRQTVVEMEYGVMLLLAVADGSCLAVLAAADADLGLVGYEASMLVRRVGAVLTPGPRSAPAARDRDRPRSGARQGPGAFGPASKLPGLDGTAAGDGDGAREWPGDWSASRSDDQPDDSPDDMPDGTRDNTPDRAPADRETDDAWTEPDADGPSASPDASPDASPEPPEPHRPPEPPRGAEPPRAPESAGSSEPPASSVRPTDPRSRRGGRQAPTDASGSPQPSVRPVERTSRQRPGRRPRR